MAHRGNRIHVEREVNRHHVWYERKGYYTPTEKVLRQLGGFVLDMYAPAHRLLHAQMRPMVKPPRYMIDDIVDLARVTPEEHRFSVLESTADFLLAKPYGNEVDDIRAARLGQHLIGQRRYFDMHPLDGDPEYGG